MGGEVSEPKVPPLRNQTPVVNRFHIVVIFEWLIVNLQISLDGRNFICGSPLTF